MRKVAGFRGHSELSSIFQTTVRSGTVLNRYGVMCNRSRVPIHSLPIGRISKKVLDGDAHDAVVI